MIRTLIKSICDAFSLNHEQLAEVMEVKLQRVRDLSSGRAKKLTREESELLVGKLDIRAEWLITGEGSMLQDDEPQDAFAERMRAIKQMQAVVAALPLTDHDRKRWSVLMSGDPAEDAVNIAAALSGGTLSSKLKPDEQVMLDRYRASPKPLRDAALRVLLGESSSRQGQVFNGQVGQAIKTKTLKQPNVSFFGEEKQKKK